MKSYIFPTIQNTFLKIRINLMLSQFWWCVNTELSSLRDLYSILSKATKLSFLRNYFLLLIPGDLTFYRTIVPTELFFIVNSRGSHILPNYRSYGTIIPFNSPRATELSFLRNFSNIKTSPGTTNLSSLRDLIPLTYLDLPV